MYLEEAGSAVGSDASQVTVSEEATLHEHLQKEAPMCGQRKIQTAAALLAAVIAGLGAAGCGALPTIPTASTIETPSINSSVIVPAGAVPWADLPAGKYLTPTPFPTPAAEPAPRCSLSGLTEEPASGGGATGNDEDFFTFRNDTSRACLTGGYPRVVLTEAGQHAVVPSPGGFWDQHFAPADLLPGATAGFFVGFTYACETGYEPPLYEHISITLPGGGTLHQTLGTQPDPRKPQTGPLLGVFGLCGVSVTELAVYPPPQSVYPVDPFSSLAATIDAPVHVASGQTIIYVVTLTNPTPAAVAMGSCRSYNQWLGVDKGPYFSLELNCAAAGPIPPYGSESFQMELPDAVSSPGTQRLCWGLAVPGSDVCRLVDVA
jgi:hypothetical protein